MCVNVANANVPLCASLMFSSVVLNDGQVWDWAVEWHLPLMVTPTTWRWRGAWLWHNSTLFYVSHQYSCKNYAYILNIILWYVQDMALYDIYNINIQNIMKHLHSVASFWQLYFFHISIIDTFFLLMLCSFIRSLLYTFLQHI